MVNISYVAMVTIMLATVLGLMLVNDLIRKRFKSKTVSFMLVVFLTGLVSCLFPFFTWGLMLGLPSVILNTVLLTLYFRNKL